MSAQNASHGSTYVLSRGSARRGLGRAHLHLQALTGDGDLVGAPRLLARWPMPEALSLELHATDGTRGAGNATPKPLAAQAAPGGLVVDLRSLPDELDVDAVWFVTTSAWDTPPPSLTPCPGRRTLVSAVVGWHAGEWLDGPLAHILATGDVASYVPSGGPAALAVLRSVPSHLQGVDLVTALATEGSDSARAHRCLSAALDALVPLPLPVTRLSGDTLTCRSAVALALLRQARPDTPLQLEVQGGVRALTPPWRRLTENAGIVVKEPGAGSAEPLSRLEAALPEALLPSLAAAVNSISEVLPKSILS